MSFTLITLGATIMCLIHAVFQNEREWAIALSTMAALLAANALGWLA